MVIGLQIRKLHRGTESAPPPAVPDSKKPGLFRVNIACFKLKPTTLNTLLNEDKAIGRTLYTYSTGWPLSKNQGNQGKSRKVKKSKHSEGKVRGFKQFS